jgi:hypothetical protein
VDLGNEQDWLLGESSWWPNSESRPAVSRIGDLQPPESWNHTDSQLGGKGWVRQRLKPVGPQILYTSSWSIFFLISSSVPLIFPNKLPIDDQLSAIILFSFSWFLLLIPFIWFSNSNNENFTFFPLDLFYFCFGGIFFILHILIDPRLGWFGFLLFLIAWVRTISNISNSLSVNSSRWLLPISLSDFSQDFFNEGWIIYSNKFRNGLIATKSDTFGPYSAELTGVSYRNYRFIAFSMVYRDRIIHDPFNINFVSNVQIDDFLLQPPLKISGEHWPEIFAVKIEEE